VQLRCRLLGKGKLRPQDERRAGIGCSCSYENKTFQFSGETFSTVWGSHDRRYGNATARIR
jgi:hypothetical protein